MPDWERFDPSERYDDATVADEHINRYVFAAARLAGKEVLDVACGTGYGSALLAKQATRVVGVDLSKAVVARASKNHSEANLQFRVGDAADLSMIRDSEFDAVVSFETLEHIKEYEVAVSEFKRVVKPNGMIVLSSPNHAVRRNIYTRAPNNPYHTQEFTLEELRSLFDGWELEIFGQGKPGKLAPIKPVIDMFIALDLFRVRRFLVRHAGFLRKAMFSSSCAKIVPIADGPNPMFFVIVATRGAHVEVARQKLAGEP